jgi:hypothetical protein
MNDTNPIGRQGIAALLSGDSGPASRHLIDLCARIAAPMPIHGEAARKFGGGARDAGDGRLLGTGVTEAAKSR